VHWARLEASALGSLIAACPAWKRREQIGRRHVLTTLIIWLTGRWSSIRVKLTLTDGQGFLQWVNG